MARRLTAAEKDERIGYLERVNTLLLLALQAVATERPDGHARAKDPEGGTTDMRLYRAQGPHGGIVVLTWRVEGQRPSVSAVYLDDLLAERHDHAWIAAVGELRGIRQRLLDGATNRTGRIA